MMHMKRIMGRIKKGISPIITLGCFDYCPDHTSVRPGRADYYRVRWSFQAESYGEF